MDYFQKYFNNFPEFGLPTFLQNIVDKFSYQGRITLSFIAVKMDKMKDIQNFMLNNILYYHFSERTC